ncbi:rep [Symbiodinium natans]|uniref:Rep protein n=1 Tax=Symbiodinium natans TaxID=878477 RepID=A0A812ICS2_9DINO|nr:rep [Symbiodinium natans]
MKSMVSSTQIRVFLAALDIAAPRVASRASLPADANVSSLQLEESGEENVVLSLLMGTRLHACVIHVASDLTVQIVSCADGPEATSCQLISLPGSGFQMFFISTNGPGLSCESQRKETL